MNYLEQFTVGEANKIVAGYSYLDAERGYKAARAELEERYGRDDVVATAFVQKAMSWPSVKADIAKGLDEFAIFLAECSNAVTCIEAVRALEYPDNLKKLVAKLPFYCHDKWRNIVQQCRAKSQSVKFHHLVDFVKVEAKKAIDPTFGKAAMTASMDQGVKPSRKQATPYRGKASFTTKTSEVTSCEGKGIKQSEAPEQVHGGYNTNSERTSEKISNKPCVYCNSLHHFFHACDKFKVLPIQERIEYLKSNGYCFGCMKQGHQKRLCHNKATCAVCKGRHPTSLHISEKKQMDPESKSWFPKANHKASVKAYSNFSRPVSSYTGAGDGICTMAVVPVRVRMRNSSQSFQTYAFLDPGSSVSFCTESLMRQLGAEGAKLKITLDTMAEPYTMNTYAINGLEIGDLDFENVVVLPKVYTKDRIPVHKDHIPTNQDISRWKHFQGINIPELEVEVGLLVGNNIPDAYTPLELRTGSRGSLYAVRTLLGWVVWNLIRQPDRHLDGSSMFPANRADILAIEKLEELKQLDVMVRESINRDFSESVINEKREHSQEDKRFLEMVSDTMSLVDGHYQMCLPFRKADIKVPNNVEQATQRLRSLKRKMEKNPEFHRDYVDFMSKVIDKQYAERVPDDELNRDDGKVWYIPHHGVYHPRKPGKIRVVFDCAAQYLGISLNSLLLQGPDLTNSLLAVLFRFRQGKVAVMGDIESMYYQVRLPKDDCDCLRFLWWPEGKLQCQPITYRMVVHLFGAGSSPSCCNAALRRNAEDNRQEFSTAAIDAVFKSFYVDDCLKSVDSEDEAIDLIQEVCDLCQRGGFHLTKWTSNSHKVLETVPTEERAKEVKQIDLQIDDLPSERALGVHWTVKADSLGFNIQLQERPPTRRGILSITSSIYDPLGFSAPFTLTGKQLPQDLCRRGINWDEEISGCDLRNWQQWLVELPRLQSISLPRCYKPECFDDLTRCELHLLSDASEKGYGVVSYLRLIDCQDKVHCSFVMAKSRVAPLKKTTVHRLELTAATVAGKLSVLITRELEYPVDNVTFWTDSMSVLRYIQSETGRFHTCVANRVAVIREISEPKQWNYVETQINPADAVSRGQKMVAFLSNKHWLNGPSFLWKPEIEWQALEVICDGLSDSDPEVRKPVNVTVSQLINATDTLLKHYSRWWKLERAAAWILLAISNLQKWVTIRKQMVEETAQTEPDTIKRHAYVEKRMRALHMSHQLHAVSKIKSSSLSLDVLRKSENALIRCEQHKHFSEEIKVLSYKDVSMQRVKKTSPIYKLDPVIVDGILRVGGRLERADIPFSAKHPALLAKDSAISRLILDDAHRSAGHLGKNYVLSRIRENYWILGANSLIKSMVAKCVTCRKYQARGGTQKMADLPVDRLTPNEPPFSRVGMDFFGPIEVRRGRCTVKRYGVVFTCLAIRAVHLEVAFSMDTDSCINSIRRFIARRGPVKLIRSDNGSNLVGSKRELSDEIMRWNESQIVSTLQQRNITWEFNPPAGSHFGGVWERMIRSVRKVLYSLLQEQSVRLDDESLQTLFCEVEAILNSRPLTEMPCNPSGLRAITPNDLLLHNSGEPLPAGLFDKNESYVRRRWRHVQYLADVFWKRWIRDYLPMLQQRQKWIHPHRNLVVGDLVLLVDNTPRSSWSLGKVLEVLKDSKGFVRMAKVKTQTNVLLRPTDKLCVVLEENCAST